MFGSFVDQYRGSYFCRPYSCIWVGLVVLYCGCYNDAFSLGFHFYCQGSKVAGFLLGEFYSQVYSQTYSFLT